MNLTNNNHQKQVNKTLKALINYNDANNTRERFENDFDTTEKANERKFESLNRVCESKWDVYLTNVSELPKYLQNQIEKSDLY